MTAYARSSSRPIRPTSALSRRAAARCKYHPTCSAYAVEAVRAYGVLRGLVLAGWRLLRCNPLSHGGFDPVERQRLFRPREPRLSGTDAMMLVLANILQPLIDVNEAVLRFFHDNVGLGWGAVDHRPDDRRSGS